MSPADRAVIGLRSVFVVTQVALALVLLVGAGLLMKSLSRLQSVEAGFNPNNLLTMRVNLPRRKYDTDGKVLDYFARAIEQAKAIPGVESAAAINTLPFDGPHSGTNMVIEGQPKPPPGQEPSTGVCVVDANYFHTMQIPLKRGRLFTPQEAAEMRHVVVVNETFARKVFPGQDPLGKRVTIHMKDENVPSEIIGIVGDTKHLGLDTEFEEMAYWPQPELVYSGMTLVMRTQGDPANAAPAARQVIRSLDPDQPVGQVITMEGLLEKAIARSRFNTVLLAAFLNCGPRDGGGRNLWSDVLLSSATHTRDWCAYGIGCAKQRRVEARGQTRSRPCALWSGYRTSGVVCVNTIDGESSV